MPNEERDGPRAARQWPYGGISVRWAIEGDAAWPRRVGAIVPGKRHGGPVIRRRRFGDTHQTPSSTKGIRPCHPCTAEVYLNGTFQ